MAKKNPSLKWNITYGSGGVSGFMSIDQLSISGDVDGKQALVAKDYVFGEVTNEQGLSFLFGKMDGIAGMAYQSISVLQTQPFFNALFDQKQVENNVFSFYMTKHKGTDVSVAVFSDS